VFSVLLVVGIWLILFISGTLQARDDRPFGSTGVTIAGLLFYTFAGSAFNILIAGVVIFLHAIKSR
jgi:hypothetical protein